MRVAELFEEKRPRNVVRPWRVKKLDVEGAIALLNKHCRESLKDIATGNVMWRGFRDLPAPGSVAVIDPSKGIRRSRDSENIYQVGMDASEAFRGYPARSRSLICTGSYSFAQKIAGDVRVALPFDGSAVAVSTKEDFFNSPTGLKTVSITSLDDGLHRLLRDLDLMPTVVVSAKQLDVLLKDISPHAVVFGLTEEFTFEIGDLKKMALEYEARTTSSNLDTRGLLKLTGKIKKGFDIRAGKAAVEKYLNETGKFLLKEFQRRPGKKFSALANLILTPAATKVTLQQPGSLKLGSNECWVASPCVVIRSQLFGEIVKEMAKQGQPVDHSLKFLIKESL